MTDDEFPDRNLDVLHARVASGRPENQRPARTWQVQLTVAFDKPAEDLFDALMEELKALAPSVGSSTEGSTLTHVTLAVEARTTPEALTVASVAVRCAGAEHDLHLVNVVSATVREWTAVEADTPLPSEVGP